MTPQNVISIGKNVRVSSNIILINYLDISVRNVRDVLVQNKSLFFVARVSSRQNIYNDIKTTYTWSAILSSSLLSPTGYNAM